MAQRMVKVKNMVNKTVSIKKPEYGVNRRWTSKNQVIPIPYEAMEQMLWDNGVKNMIDRGMLYIVDLQDKIDLGLEPEGVTEPVNIRVLSDKQIEELLTSIPLSVFKNELKTLPESQIKEIVNYSIMHEIVSADKCAYLKELTGVDILKAVSRNQEVAAAEAKGI